MKREATTKLVALSNEEVMNTFGGYAPTKPGVEIDPDKGTIIIRTPGDGDKPWICW